MFVRGRPLVAEGAVAQLGERLICIQEVAGSIPTSSTKLKLLWAEKRPTQPLYGRAVWRYLSAGIAGSLVRQLPGL